MQKKENKLKSPWKPSEEEIKAFVQSNQQFFETITKQIQKAYTGIQKTVTSFHNPNKILLKYNWVYSFWIPSECYQEVIKIHRSGKNVEDQINSFFVNYFTKDNFSALDEMVAEWNNNPIF